MTACDELSSPQDSEEPGTGVTDGPGTGGPGTGGPGTGVTDEPGTAPSSGVPTDDLTGIDDGTVEAHIRGLDGEVLVGSSITLDGSGSTNTTEEDMTFSWTVRERPTGSVADVADATAEVTSFTPDRPGEYRIRLVVRAGEFEGVDNLVFETAGCPDAVVISGGTISSDEVWASQGGACPAYVVEGNVSVRAELRIEAGTTILFRDDAAISVESGGALRAEGTADAPIILRGTEDERGWWRGVRFETNRPTNRLAFVTIDGAGSAALHNTTEPAGLTVGRSSRTAGVRITDSTFTNNAGYGLFAHGGSSFNAFERNTFTDNDAPMAISPTHLVQLDTESVFTGNDRDMVDVGSGTLDDEGTIPSLDVPYRSAGFTLDDEEITIAPGTTFIMRDSTSVVVDDAVIIMDGTADAPIVFRGAELESGWWNGVFIEDTQHPQNRMSHVIIEHGGREAFHGTTEPAALTIGRSSRTAGIAIDNLILRESEGYGLFAHGGSTISSWDALSFENNGAAAASLHTVHLGAVDEFSTATGNGNDALELRGGTTGGTATWRNPGLPYAVTGDVTVAHDVTIEAGTSFVFAAEQGFTVDGSRIVMAGEAGDPILFVGSSDQAGWWLGVFIEQTSGDTSVIENIVIEDAGRTFFHNSTQPAGLTIGRSSRSADVTVTGSSISNIGQPGTDDVTGLFVHSGSTVNADICDVNTFEGINGDDDCVGP